MSSIEDHSKDESNRQISCRQETRYYEDAYD